MYLHNFFFSSRRRHTRLQGDWSSDMCSSDLGEQLFGGVEDALANFDAIGGGSGHRVWIIDQIRFLVNTKRWRFGALVEGILDEVVGPLEDPQVSRSRERDRKSTRLNSSHLVNS